MKSLYKSPLGELSYLKEFHLDVEMLGEHFDALAKSSEENYEKTVVSILTDLLDEDANMLTLQEMTYLFLLVRIHSLSNNLTEEVECTNTVLKQTEFGTRRERCGAKNLIDIRLSDADLNYIPEDYKPQTIIVKLGEREASYKVIPPPMKEEIDLIGYFQERGFLRKQLMSGKDEDRGLLLEYAKHRGFLFLQNVETGETFYDRNRRQRAVAASLKAPAKFVPTLLKAVKDVEAFGLKTLEKKYKCKECGMDLTVQMPFLDSTLM